MTCVALPPKVFPAPVIGLFTHVDPDALASESDGGSVHSVTPARSTNAVPLPLKIAESLSDCLQ